MSRSVASFVFVALMLIGISSGRIVPAGRLPIRNDGVRKGSDHQHDDDLSTPMATRQALPSENENAHWLRQADSFVQAQRALPVNRGRAKNVIMFLGDGMSATTIAAARPYVDAEQTPLHFERLPHVGMAKTYCVDKQVSDSASTATAYLGGVKANYGTVGVTSAVERYNCSQQYLPENQVKSIAAWAQDAGKWTGFVTTSPVTDASPAGLYAHAANRYWENDYEMQSRCDDPKAEDIARQLLNSKVGAQMRVIMGGGREDFRGIEVQDEEKGTGARRDRRNLINEWLEKKTGQRAEYVWNATHLRQLDAANVDYLLGLFEPSSLKFHRDVQDERDVALEPTLTEMTLKAIEVLSRNPDGFYLFVENGKIDSAHHSTYARLAIDETAELAKAVAAARAVLSDDDTLMVVTADHSHTLTYAGYPTRGADVLDKVFDSSDDQMPYMTLSYANGDGYSNQWEPNSGRKNLSDVDTSSLWFRYPSTVPVSSETHAGDDVVVYASGPWSHLFDGVYEQHVIPHLMAHAACLNGACDN